MELTPHDVAIWRTINANRAIDRDELHLFPREHAPFPPANPSEYLLAHGQFVLSAHMAVGDGTYYQDNSFFFATGALGLALTAGLMAGRAAGNSHRRVQAAQDAQKRWREIDRGMLWVATTGLYLHTANGLFPWAWVQVTSMTLAGPRLVVFTGQSTQGDVQWLLQSDWAELAFTMWCRARHPHHPQFTGFTWIPQGWADRVRESGAVPPPHPSTIRRKLES